uniref:GDP-mannose 4,6-dehydratase n=1 Tax=viral metagenome TaxID=1070528 RepID=A0A6M3IZW4_9ZZZZ
MRALITGVTGQDGGYLAGHLHGAGYDVWGMVRSARAALHDSVKAAYPYLHLVTGDVTEPSSIAAALAMSQPDEVYNLAAMTHVLDSFSNAHGTMEVNGLGAANVFEAVASCRPYAKVYQASTSELYGNIYKKVGRPLTELDMMAPISPYGVSKLHAHTMAHVWRKRGLYVACGILFNHESPRRDPSFLTRKVTLGLARCKVGLHSAVRLGHLDSVRDWGYAPEYVNAMRLILQQSTPGDYVVATGVGTSVRQWLDLVAREYGMDWHAYVQQDEAFIRPSELDYLVGDASLAGEHLGWYAHTKAKELAAIMCQADMKRARAEAEEEEYGPVGTGHSS